MAAPWRRTCRSWGVRSPRAKAAHRARHRVGVAVLREGSEVVLFLYGVAASGGTTALHGDGRPARRPCRRGLSALMYFGLLTSPRAISSPSPPALITLLAAGLAAQAVAFLQQAGYLDSSPGPLWDTSWPAARQQSARPPSPYSRGLLGPPDGGAARRLWPDRRHHCGSDAVAAQRTSRTRRHPHAVARPRRELTVPILPCAMTASRAGAI